MTPFITFFTPLTIASAQPFYHGASAGVKFHSIPFSTPKVLRVSQSKSSNNDLNSLSAAVSWVPGSEYNFDG